MSVLEGSVSCVPHLAETDTENNDIVNSDSASILDAETVQNTNTHNSHVEETLNDGELLKGLLTDTFCQVCEAVLLFESQRVSHYEGKKHAQRVKIYLQTKKAERKEQRLEISRFRSGNVDPERFCELCNMVFSSPVVAKSHYEGKIHAKNMRKINTATSVADVRGTVGSPVPTMTTRHEASRGETEQEQKDSAASTLQGVDLDDPHKHCKLCTASFNNPLIAQQHYSGRKHQRRLCKLGKDPQHVHSLTCPVCCVTLSSIETYQAHMQGNKHHIKEKKTVGLGKAQKKVYDSFQDELADYIQVQRARGLEPKTGQGPEVPAHRTTEEEDKGTGQDEEGARISAPVSHALPPSLQTPQWHPPFHPRTTQFTFKGKLPVQKHWNQGYPAHPPPLIPGLTGRSLHRGRSPDSSSSSSFSDSSSSSSYGSSSGSSSIGSSEDSRERRRRRRQRRDRARSRREQADDSAKDTERRQSHRRSRKEGAEERDHLRKVRRPRRMSVEDEQGEQGEDVDAERRKRKVKRPRGGDSDDSEAGDGRKRRPGKKNKRHKEGHHGKRWREGDEGEWSKVSDEEVAERGVGGAPSMLEHPLGGRPEPEDERAKCKREKKKKTKDKMDKGDTRTEEEKLWDETILGLF